ncbi:hypothetical protein GCM10011575_33000 [Microlunatus endophyticus]|uniref:Uncharacterized protein n=1 Tax=Microlunatus endophyticus TaxID=1716077 RepID=A0A917SCD0_9ACTN|nr:hypothetical protein [Microlunatus endophyticus]GGL72030.1 hypothetical protein GCM10011575_33000 [Microlunatus endophyticus]
MDRATLLDGICRQLRAGRLVASGTALVQEPDDAIKMIDSWSKHIYVGLADPFMAIRMAPRCRHVENAPAAPTQ